MAGTTTAAAKHRLNRLLSIDVAYLHVNHCNIPSSVPRTPHRLQRDPGSEWRRGTRECDAMAKYDPLLEFLCRRPTVTLDLNFEDLEVLVGPLPASARRYPAWWANEAEGGRHVQARAWLNAGREVERVDVNRGSVRFCVARWRGVARQRQLPARTSRQIPVLVLEPAAS